VSTVTEIREAIQKLAAKEAWQLAEELRDHLDASRRTKRRPSNCRHS